MSLFDSIKPTVNLLKLTSLWTPSIALLISSLVMPAYAEITYSSSVSNLSNHSNVSNLSNVNTISNITVNNDSAHKPTITRYADDTVLNNLSRYDDMGLPEVFSEVISVELDGLLLSDVLYVMTYGSGYDIVVSRDLDRVILNNASYSNTPVRHIISDIMQKNNLTYSYIGDDLMFVYHDNDYGECMYNTDVWRGKLLDKTAIHADAPRPLSINITQLELSALFKLIGDFTDYQLFVNDQLLSTKKATNIDLDKTTESIKLTNTTLDQVLTTLAYRNNFDYRYVGNNKIIIVPSQNLEQCQSASKQIKYRPPLANDNDIG